MDSNVMTLLLLKTTMSAGLTAALVLFWHLHRTIGGLGHWAIGMGCVTLGLVAVTGRGALPDLFTIVAANGLLLLGPLLTWNGMRRYTGRPARWAAPLAAILLTLLALAAYTFWLPDLRARILLMSLALGVGFAACAWEVRHAVADTSRTATRMVAICYILVAAGLFVRAGLHLGLDEIQPGQAAWLTSHSAVEAGYFFYQSCVMVLTVLSLIVMTTQRLHTRTNRQNAQLSRLAADLDAAYRRADQANRAKSDFLATVSHELRTPLNAVIGFSDLALTLRDHPDTAARRDDYLRHILDSGRHLLSIVDDILDLAKAEAGRLTIEPVEVEIARTLHRTAGIIDTRARERGLTVTIEADPALVTCRADERAFAQIMLNLLTNAVKFSDPGGTITVRAAPAPDGGAEISVRDEGPGIPPGEIDRLLRPFEQLHNSYAAAGGGTGLGLSIVEALMRLHGGALRIDSTPGHGTCVTIWFPPPHDPGGTEPPAAEPGRRGPATGRTGPRNAPDPLLAAEPRH